MKIFKANDGVNFTLGTKSSLKRLNSALREIFWVSESQTGLKLAEVTVV